MAIPKKNTTPRMTSSEMKKQIALLQMENQKLKEGAYCYMCGQHKPKKDFYSCKDPLTKSGVTRICKRCASDIALRVDKYGDAHEPTLDSIQLALQYLDKPFISTIYDASIQEVDRSAKVQYAKSNVWGAYIRNISIPAYAEMTWQDSDFFKDPCELPDEDEQADLVKGRDGQFVYSDFVKNKEDVVRLLSYDPFEKEALSDQPFLYSQLVGLLDKSEDANDDMMRNASAISIVRAFLQQAKIDNTIADLMRDPTQLKQNASMIKALNDSKSKLATMITNLAAESCISLKNTKNAKKGENTWTGKLKRIKDLNLRDGSVNGYDVETCKGMQQVADISMAAIVKALALDESEWADIVTQQRQELDKLTRKTEAMQEACRILLAENLELRDTLSEHNLLSTDNLVDLNQIVQTYAETEDADTEDKK